MTEADLMLLEEYLDGELSAADGRAVEERCVRELELASELNRLRGDRQIRAQAWRAMEGDDAAVEAVAGKVATVIARRESHVRLMHGLRIGFAAAACVIIGLGAGFFARSPHPTNVATTANPPPNSDRIVMTNRPASSEPPPAGYDVKFTDPQTGKVVAVQHFASMEQAHQFIQDVGQWQEQQEQMHNGNVSLVADQY